MILYETSLLGKKKDKLDNENVEPAYRNSPVVVCLPLVELGWLLKTGGWKEHSTLSSTMENIPKPTAYKPPSYI